MPAGRDVEELTAVVARPQAGMRWRPEHLQAVRSLRALHRSGRWAACWAGRPLLRSRCAPGHPSGRPGGRGGTPPAPPRAGPAAARPRPWQRSRHPWRCRALSAKQPA